MAIDTGGALKEAKILGQSEAVLKGLAALLETVAGSFDRTPKPTGGIEERTQIPNVLDEVLDNLSLAVGKIADLHAFIASRVIHKIH